MPTKDEIKQERDELRNRVDDLEEDLTEAEMERDYLRECVNIAEDVIETLGDEVEGVAETYNDKVELKQTRQQRAARTVEEEYNDSDPSDVA
ncbi:MAG: hypothetical protein BRC55_16090 [Cyanobacteria bacterium SW_8_48_13]|nr:MAG: hypothetical protein BRC55_16090 [Cyanobacteria bacterium SW_8_48_13]